MTQKSSSMHKAPRRFDGSLKLLLFVSYIIVGLLLHPNKMQMWCEQIWESVLQWRHPHVHVSSSTLWDSAVTGPLFGLCLALAPSSSRPWWSEVQLRLFIPLWHHQGYSVWTFGEAKRAVKCFCLIVGFGNLASIFGRGNPNLERSLGVMY